MVQARLSPEEEKVIVRKGTEAPFSGEYNEHFADGIYVCRRCGAALYDSGHKFRSDCGWPSFDDEVAGAVKRTTDPDGTRTEISCRNCGAHLGHVFSGERLTGKNIRHCVNSLSLKFIPRDFRAGEREAAVFGGGCFWCLDALFRTVPGVNSVTSGYAGGHKPDPTYAEVSAGQTGHAEVVRVEYEPKTVSYLELLKIFFSAHDPTTPNRQGNDIGEQYRSVILYLTVGQKEAAENHIRALTEKGVYTRPIATEVKPLAVFYPAEDYHQDYYVRHPENSYCRSVIAPKLEKFNA